MFVVERPAPSEIVTSYRELSANISNEGSGPIMYKLANEIQSNVNRYLDGNENTYRAIIGKFYDKFRAEAAQQLCKLFPSFSEECILHCSVLLSPLGGFTVASSVGKFAADVKGKSSIEVS